MVFSNRLKWYETAADLNWHDTRSCKLEFRVVAFHLVLCFCFYWNFRGFPCIFQLVSQRCKKRQPCRSGGRKRKCRPWRKWIRIQLKKKTSASIQPRTNLPKLALPPSLRPSPLDQTNSDGFGPGPARQPSAPKFRWSARWTSRPPDASASRREIDG